MCSKNSLGIISSTPTAILIEQLEGKLTEEEAIRLAGCRSYSGLLKLVRLDREAKIPPILSNEGFVALIGTA